MYKLFVVSFVILIACNTDNGKHTEGFVNSKEQTGAKVADEYVPDKQLCSSLEEMSIALREASVNEKFKERKKEFLQLDSALGDMRSVACKQ